MAEQKYVVIVEKSVGNESVGDMWKETTIVSAATTVEEVMKWALGKDFLPGQPSRHQIILTKPDEKINKKYGNYILKPPC